MKNILERKSDDLDRTSKVLIGIMINNKKRKENEMKKAKKIVKVAKKVSK